MDFDLPSTLAFTSSACACDSSCPNFYDAGVDQVEPILVMDQWDAADRWDSLCPIEATYRCVASSCENGGPNASMLGVPLSETSQVLSILDGCSSDWTPRPLAVILSMEISVADPGAFVANPGSKAAVEGGIAASAGVLPGKVDATLSVARRLQVLQASGRRLQGAVSVAATIQAENAGAVAALQASVAAIPADAMATALNTALTNAGIDASVSVSSMSAAPAPPPLAPTPAPALAPASTSAPAPAPTPAPALALASTSMSEVSTPLDQGGQAEPNSAFKATFCGGLLIALAMQLSV